MPTAYELLNTLVSDAKRLIKLLENKDCPESTTNPNYISAQSKAQPEPIPPRNRTGADDNPIPISQHHSDEKKKYSVEWWKPRAEIFGIFAALALLAVNGCQAWITGKAVNVSKGQLEEMRNQRVMDERAWVFVTELATIPQSNSVTFVVKFKNSGRTPAFDLQTTAGQVQINPPYDERNLPPDVSRGIASLDNRPPEYQNIMAPNEELVMAVKSVDDQPTIDRKRTSYIYGKIWYNDIFKRPHWTTFCGMYETNKIFRAAGFHNSCDDVETYNPNQ